MIERIGFAALVVLTMVVGCARNATEAQTETAPVDTQTQTDSRDKIGRIYHYVRSNIDGTEREDVYVFRKRVDFVEVYKSRAKCYNAALVTAELDMEGGYAPVITGGRLLPDAQHHEFAFLTFDAATSELSVRAELPDRDPIIQTVTIEHMPFHLYDFDFASLTVMTPHLEDPQASFSFGLPMIIPDLTRDEFLVYLGEAVAIFRKKEEHNGRPAYRYALGGSAFGSYGGNLWLDAEEGHILNVTTGIPNHLEYDDFKLTLEGIEDGGETAWTELLKRHFEGCE